MSSRGVSDTFISLILTCNFIKITVLSLICHLVLAQQCVIFEKKK